MNTISNIKSFKLNKKDEGIHEKLQKFMLVKRKKDHLLIHQPKMGNLLAKRRNYLDDFGKTLHLHHLSKFAHLPLYPSP